MITNPKTCEGKTCQHVISRRNQENMEHPPTKKKTKKGKIYNEDYHVPNTLKKK